MKRDAFDYALARQRIEERQLRRRDANLALWQDAERDARQIVAMIVARYEPARIYQWGSVLQPKKFTAMSDIDIAIEGIDSIRMLSVLADAEELTRFPLDIVRLESVEPAFRRAILKKGTVVYAR